MSFAEPTFDTNTDVEGFSLTDAETQNIAAEVDRLRPLVQDFPTQILHINLEYNSVLQMVRIEVADNGRGISPENKLHLFEPYFSTKKQGTGLGLAIVNTIVTDHNGFIRVLDNHPKGTRFIIELPVRV